MNWRRGTVVRGKGIAQLFGYVAHAVTGVHMIPDPLPHPEGAVTLKLDGFSQLDNFSCGAVAGWCVVHSFDKRRNLDRFYRMCKVTPKTGVTMANLMKALNGNGVGTLYRRAVTFERLRGWINQGYPIICNIRHETEGEDADARHWVVVYGYRDKPKAVYVAGNGWMHLLGSLSVEGKHRMPWSGFKRGFCGHALVCYPLSGGGLPLVRSRLRS